MPPPALSGIILRIGHSIAELIEDGSTMRMGIGAIPDAVLRSLAGNRDVGIHSCMAAGISPDALPA